MAMFAILKATFDGLSTQDETFLSHLPADVDLGTPVLYERPDTTQFYVFLSNNFTLEDMARIGAIDLSAVDYEAVADVLAAIGEDDDPFFEVMDAQGNSADYVAGLAVPDDWTLV